MRTTPRKLRAGMMLDQDMVERISKLEKLQQAPLCANHAETWYCERPNIMTNSGCVWCDLVAERDSARRELEQLKKDKQRLDWLESDEGSMQPVMRLIRKHGEVGESLTFRQAIDAAMRKETQ